MTLSCVKGARYPGTISGGQAGADASCHMTPIPLHWSPMTKYEPRSGFVYLGNVSSGRVGLISSLTQVGSRVVLRVESS